QTGARRGEPGRRVRADFVGSPRGGADGAFRHAAYCCRRIDAPECALMSAPTPERGPGHILFLTHGDTDVLAVASIAGSLDPQLPPVRVHNVGYLRDEDVALPFFEEHVRGAAILLVKLHGGVRSLPAFAEMVRIADQERVPVVAIPGTDDLDPELTAYSTAGVPTSHEAKAYFQLGGLENIRQCF